MVADSIDFSLGSGPGMGFLASGRFNHALDVRLASLPLSVAQHTAIDRERPHLAGARVPTSFAPNLARATRTAIGESFGVAFRDVMWTGALLAALAAIVGWATASGAGTQTSDGASRPS